MLFCVLHKYIYLYFVKYYFNDNEIEMVFLVICREFGIGLMTKVIKGYYLRKEINKLAFFITKGNLKRFQHFYDTKINGLTNEIGNGQVELPNVQTWKNTFIEYLKMNSVQIDACEFC